MIRLGISPEGITTYNNFSTLLFVKPCDSTYIYLVVTQTSLIRLLGRSWANQERGLTSTPYYYSMLLLTDND